MVIPPSSMVLLPSILPSPILHDIFPLLIIEKFDIYQTCSWISQFCPDYQGSCSFSILLLLRQKNIFLLLLFPFPFPPQKIFSFFKYFPSLNIFLLFVPRFHLVRKKCFPSLIIFFLSLFNFSSASHKIFSFSKYSPAVSFPFFSPLQKNYCLLTNIILLFLRCTLMYSFNNVQIMH